MRMRKIQDYPAPDSSPTDPFEALVAVYYQLNGYITSSNKWFWVWESRKRQRGYQDIDALAVNADETLIVSVTAALDDKVRRTKEGVLRQDMLSHLTEHFTRVRDYLASVPSYAWLVSDSRRVRRVVAFSSGDGLADTIRDDLHKHGIELLSGKEIVTYLRRAIAEQQKPGLRTNNQLIKTIQLIMRQE